MKYLAMAMFAGCVLTSCNTMIGLGRDIRMLGEGMERKAHGETFEGDRQRGDENVPTY